MNWTIKRVLAFLGIEYTVLETPLVSVMAAAQQDRDDIRRRMALKDLQILSLRTNIVEDLVSRELAGE